MTSTSPLSPAAQTAHLTAAIDEAFAPLTELLASRFEHVGNTWSPAQHTRGAARRPAAVREIL